MYEVFPLGALSALDMTLFETIVCDYLTYADIVSLRNCCNYLHNFTKNLRLNWKIFGRSRRMMINIVVNLFLQMSKLDDEGTIAPTFILCDKHGHEICPRHLKLQCPDNYCHKSHLELSYDRKDISALNAYITYDDLIYFISIIFGPKFYWKYGGFFQPMFHAFGEDYDLIVRKVLRMCSLVAVVVVVHEHFYHRHHDQYHNRQF